MHDFHWIKSLEIDGAIAGIPYDSLKMQSATGLEDLPPSFEHT